MNRILSARSAGLRMAAILFAIALHPHVVWCEEPKELWTLKTDHNVEKFRCLSFSPDGKLIAAGVGHIVQIWDFPTLARRADLKHVVSSKSIEFKLSINSIAFSPDGKLLAAGGMLGKITLWNVNTGKEKIAIEHHPIARDSEVTAIAFTPEGTSLISAGINTPVRVWDVDSGKERRNLGKQKGLAVLAVSADGKKLALGGSGPLRILDPSTDAVLGSFGSVEDVTSCLAFTPDGKSLAWAQWENMPKPIQLLDVESGKVRATITVDATVSSMAFSPNGKILASHSSSGTRLWDSTSGKELLAISSKSPLKGFVTFSPDSKVMAVAEESIIKLWDVAKYAQ